VSSFAAVAVLLMVVGGAVAVLTRSRRRRLAAEANLQKRFEAMAERLTGSPVEATTDGWRLSLAGATSLRVPARRLLEAARRAERAGEETPEERWAVHLAWLRSPIPTLEGPLQLKTHGPRIVPRLAHPEVLHLLTAEPRPVWRPAALQGLGTLYVLIGSAQERLITEEALREAGVDGRDLAGIALAVLRQRFEEEVLARALTGELVELRPTDGCGASRVLVAGDFLAAGQRLVAGIPAPGALWLTLPRRREDLFALLESRTQEEPLSRRLLDIDAGGARWAAV
jgi:hypothetical protein